MRQQRIDQIWEEIFNHLENQEYYRTQRINPKPPNRRRHQLVTTPTINTGNEKEKKHERK